MLGCGSWCDSAWFSQQWDEAFIRAEDPSIEYLELYGVTAGILLWGDRFVNRRIKVKCDNQAVVQMINNGSSNCMILIRIIALRSMQLNLWVFAEFVRGKNNEIADALSRMQRKHFLILSENMQMNRQASIFPEMLWPMNKVWFCKDC